MAEYRLPVHYGEDPKPIDIKVTLTFKGRDAQEAIAVESIESDPPKILKFTVDAEQSTDEIAVYKVELGEELLASNVKFYEHVVQPIEFTVRAKPAKGSPRAGSGESITIRGTVRVDLPPSEVKWWDMRTTPPTPNPDPIDVLADGKDAFRLRVTYETWLPCAPAGGATTWSQPYWDSSSKRGYDPEIVEFSHMTGPHFPPEIFGPRADDLPRDVAQPGSGNNRELSWWDSHCSLPSDAHPSVDLPLTDHVRVRVWAMDRITGRRRNAIDLTGSGAQLFEQMVNVRLRPPPIRTEVLRPKIPIPADGQPHEIELRFTDTKTGQVLKAGELSWELDTSADAPGGTIEPASVQLREEDNGCTVLRWTPPALDYKPGANYRQPIKVYRGTGAKRLPEQPVEVWCNPALHLVVDGIRCGFEWEPLPSGAGRSYRKDVVAGESPAVVSVHLGAKFVEPFAAKSVEEHVFEAQPDLAVESQGARVALTVDVRTDSGGRAQVELPEIARGWATRTDGGDTKPLSTLAAFSEEPPSHPSEEAVRALGAAKGVYERDRGGVLFPQILDDGTKSAISDTGVFQTRHLAAWPAGDCQKAIHGTTLVKTALTGAITIEAIQRKIVEDGAERLAKAFWGFFGVLLSFVKLDKVFGRIPGVGKALAAAYRKALAGMLRAGRALLQRIAQDVRRVVAKKLGDVAGGWADKIAQALIQLFDEGINQGSDLGGEASIKARLERVIGDLSGDINEALAGVMGAVDAGAYAVDPGRPGRYILALQRLENGAPAVDLDTTYYEDLVDEITSYGDNMTNVGIALLILGGLASLTGVGVALGAPTATIGAALLAISTVGGAVAGAATGLIYGAHAWGQLAYAANLGEEYKRLTREMVGS
jgi:hypothetical protein